jgi:ribosomal protein S18 acetylase RimI-like enzyme
MSKHEKDMGLLPIMSPLFNLREICKQMSLLEDHLNNPRKRCHDCIRKHFLTIEALFEEAVSLDKDLEYDQYLDGKAQEVRDLQGSYLDAKDTSGEDKAFRMLAQALRAMRKTFAPDCFDVRKMASIERRASEHICSHIWKRATKTTSENEDQAIESLIKPAPKKKPPRKDLKKRRVELDDKDLQGTGRGDKGDPDLSRRDRKMASYRMKESDKKVVDAFVLERSAEGAVLRTDGKKLFKLDLMEGLFARWVGGKISITSPEATKSDEVILRYLIKKAGKGMVRFDYERKGHAEPITFTHGGDALYAGQYDAYVEALVGSKVIGRVDFILWEEDGEKKFSIKMVEVDPEYRRGGIATKLYRYMQKQYKLKANMEEKVMRSEEGQAFRDSFRLAQRIASLYLGR